jgi:hypothetical protein
MIKEGHQRLRYAPTSLSRSVSPDAKRFDSLIPWRRKISHGFVERFLSRINSSIIASRCRAWSNVGTPNLARSESVTPVLTSYNRTGPSPVEQYCVPNR